MITKETWRPVTGYEGLYEVSDLGQVRSLDRCIKHWKFGVCLRHGTIMKLTNRNGYFDVQLFKDGYGKIHKVHRLVARAFPEICGEWFEGCVINHKDENPSNNNATNLEVCTQAYNSNYGTGIERRVKKKSKAVYQISLQGEIMNVFQSVKEAGEKTGLWHSNISAVCKGKHSSAGGFKWRYV